MKKILIMIVFILLSVFNSCINPTSTDSDNQCSKTKTDTLIVHDTVKIEIIKSDTIYARPNLSGSSTAIGKTNLDTAFLYSLKTIRVFWPEIPDAIGYRVYIEIPGTGTYEMNDRVYKTTYPGFENHYEMDIEELSISGYIDGSMVIYFYVLGVDSKGLDGPVSEPYPYMFY